MELDISHQVFGIATAILGVPASELTVDASPATVSSWDSFQQILLILAIEEAFGISFPEEDILSMDSLGSILHLVLKRLG